MESAEQPANTLHKNVGKSLQQLGHHTVSTIPPNEGQVFAEDLKGMAVDVLHTAKTDLEDIVSGGVTHVRTTTGNKGLSVLKEKMRKFKLWK